MLRKLKTLRADQRALGLLAGSRWSVLRAANHRGMLVTESVEVRPPALRHPVVVRMQKSSDPHVFDQIFVESEFAVLDRLREAPRLVLDLGANVGFASALFLNMFPNAFVLAVEPDPDNARRCMDNLAPYGSRARVVVGAVWPTPGRLVLSRGTFRDGKEWSTEVRQAGDGETPDVTAWDIPGLLALCPSPSIDLLKIDIEGSEQALFSTGTEGWLQHVRNICVELHGPDSERAFLKALEAYDFERLSSGDEHTVCLNVRRKSQPAAETTSGRHRGS
jgi:FkbM family methyltransferase